VIGAELQCATGANFASFVELDFFEHATQATPVIQGRRQVALPKHNMHSMHNSRTFSTASALPFATTCRIAVHNYERFVCEGEDAHNALCCTQA